MGAGGIGPDSVQVNALNSNVGAGTPLTARYQWDFGDPSGRFDQLTGFSAAHVYNNPGVYTVTLTITNEAGKISSARASVSVLADNRRTIYVDTNGNDSNNGLSPSSPIRTVARANALQRAGNVRLLFHDGETFPVTTPIGISVVSKDVLIGSYGSGAQPVLKMTAHSTMIHTYADHTVIQGLTFDSVFTPVGNIANHFTGIALAIGGTNQLVRNNTFLNVDDAINTNTMPHGLLIEDNTAPDPTGIRGYFFWCQGSDEVVLGNTVVNSTREHVMRASLFSHLLVAYNDFTNANRQNVDPQDFSKGTIEIQKGAYAYVAYNNVHGGPIRTGPLGNHSEASNTSTEWVVLDGNQTHDYPINIYTGSHHVMIRNNILNDTNGVGIALIPKDSEGRYLLDIQILNNTGINSGHVGQFLHTAGAATPGSITLGNNLYIAPNLTPGTYGAAPVYVTETDLTSFKAIFNNIWPDPVNIFRYAQGGINWVWPNYTGTIGFKTPQEWNAYPQVFNDIFRNIQISGNGTPLQSLAGLGRTVPGVITDLNGNLRSGVNAVGAVQK